MLTIVYVTGREEPHIDWFIDSLCSQDLELDYDLVIVDRLKATRPEGWPFFREDLLHVAPKPTPWQGPYRQTKEDWFAMANSRNTGLCYAKDGYVVFVDDLSVLDKNWTKAVRRAMVGGYCVAGAYQKVNDIQVKYGQLISYRPGTRDVRWDQQQADVADCPGGWLFGCSCGFPVNDLLDVNGWPEYCDGCGGEDTAMGKILIKAGKKLRYDKTLFTTESEEDHFKGEMLRKEDKGVSPNDKSHAIQHQAEKTNWSPNPFNIREIRKVILAGGPFPPPTDPAVKDWYDGQLLKDM